MMKRKTTDNIDADVSATKMAGKSDGGMKIVGEESYDAMKIIEKDIDAMKIAGEAGNVTEDQKAVSSQMRVKKEIGETSIIA
uniref:Uncharacterized protein n=1 Tax=Romanomermis culicivorax TaxID=13658 RepID=A0A915J4U1_ROMCU